MVVWAVVFRLQELLVIWANSLFFFWVGWPCLTGHKSEFILQQLFLVLHDGSEHVVRYLYRGWSGVNYCVNFWPLQNLIPHERKRMYLKLPMLFCWIWILDLNWMFFAFSLSLAFLEILFLMCTKCDLWFTYFLIVLIHIQSHNGRNSSLLKLINYRIRSSIVFRRYPDKRLPQISWLNIVISSILQHNFEWYLF